MLTDYSNARLDKVLPGAGPEATFGGGAPTATLSPSQARAWAAEQ
jgi:hypothetical protein